MNNRFFIVAYLATSTNAQSIGNISFKTNGDFLNQIQSINIIKKNNPPYLRVVITSILEVNEEDYIFWNKK